MVTDIANNLVGNDFLPDRPFTRKVETWTFYQVESPIGKRQNAPKQKSANQISVF